MALARQLVARGTRSWSFWIPPGLSLWASAGATLRPEFLLRINMHRRIGQAPGIAYSSSSSFQEQQELLCMCRIFGEKARALGRKTTRWTGFAASEAVPRKLCCQHVDRQQTGYDLVTRLGKELRVMPKSESVSLSWQVRGRASCGKRALT